MQQLIIIPPSNLGIRGADAWGSGVFGARRTKASAGTEHAGDSDAAMPYRHRGLDFIVEPGQELLCPCDGEVTWLGFAYLGDDRFRSIHIRPSAAPEADVKLLYALLKRRPGDESRYDSLELPCKVAAAEPFAIAQDLREKYEGITPHVHLEIVFHGAAIDPTPLLAEAA